MIDSYLVYDDNDRFIIEIEAQNFVGITDELMEKVLDLARMVDEDNEWVFPHDLNLVVIEESTGERKELEIDIYRFRPEVEEDLIKDYKHCY